MTMPTATSKYLSYDPNREGPNVTGVYSLAKAAGKFYILVNSREYDNWKANPNHYRVTDGKLIQIATENSSATVKVFETEKRHAKDSILQPLRVSYGENETVFEYVVDLSFQINLSIALQVASMYSDSLRYFWCKNLSTQEWIFREHSYADLMKIAVTLTERREQVSSELYTKL